MKWPIILACLLAGCASNASYHSVIGRSPAEGPQDAAECQLMALGYSSQTPRPLPIYDATITSRTISVTPNPYSQAANSFSDMGDAFSTMAIRERVRDTCLRAKGWVRVQ